MTFASVALVVLLCLLAEAFFSGSEIGVVSADRARLHHAAERGSRGAQVALRMLEKPEWLLSTTLVGTNIAIVTNTTVATAYTAQVLGESYSWLSVAVVAPLTWVFGEIVAKGVFQQRADALTPRVIFALRAASFLFWPVLIVFTTLTRGLSRVLGGKVHANPYTLREEISRMVETAPVGGDIQVSERQMIRRALRISETRARDVMVPLIDAVCIERSASAGEASRVARESGHVRLPVFEQRVDKVVGVVNVLDLLTQPSESPLAPHVLPPIFVPGSKQIESLLRDLRRAGRVLAVVVDEFGGAEGIITVEDIIEVLVGELEDEYDPPDRSPVWIRKQGDRDYRMSGRVGVQLLYDRLGITLPEGNYETVAGFLIELARDIPAAGTQLRYRQYVFSVERVSDQMILEVRLQWDEGD